MKKKYQAASTLWDDLDYLEARNTKDELEEKARNERKRKQEIEERAAKKQMAVSSSLRPRASRSSHVCIKLSTCDPSKPVKLDLHLV